tara:strand:+ start:11121 stop:11471 length:351 start_codon:yes stop_codon:yes gene_type:complete
MGRYQATVEGEMVYIEADLGRIKVGPLSTMLEIIGGPSWTIIYDDIDRARVDLDTSDEGLTIDVRDTIEAMTFGGKFLMTLKSQPEIVPGGSNDTVSPRLGLFMGRLIENLEYGVR